MTHLVMFDIDGTLVDSRGFDTDRYLQAAREVLGDDVDIDPTWLRYTHVSDSGVLEQILEERGVPHPFDALRDAVKRRFVELTHEHCARNPATLREIAGARRMFDAVRGLDGVHVAIATGGWRETAELKLRAIGVSIEGVAMATASDRVARTHIMALAEERALRGTKPRRRTYFGDGAWDKRASAELGYDFIAIGPHVEHHVRFDDFSDPAAVLARLAG
jgi:phosphoglycolate phosphatase-like HAD superfamily hydrolase